VGARRTVRAAVVAVTATSLLTLGSLPGVAADPDPSAGDATASSTDAPSAARAVEVAGLVDPTVGARPGPDLLYAEPLTDPGTAPGGRWRLPATGVSGTTVVGDGELVHTGWPFDDHGADTVPFPLAPILIDAEPAVRNTIFSGRTGDLAYPTDRDRFGANAADLVELRVRPDADGLAFRITWNTLLEPGVPIVAIGIDIDGDDAEVDWDRGLGVLGPTGVDHVLATDGVVADLDGTPVPTSTDLDRGSVEVVVPTDVLDLDDDTVLELFAVSGISDGEGGFVPAGPRATDEAPGGDPDGTAPPVFDVAFRANDQEPAGMIEPDALSSQTATFGTWRSHAMARALAVRDISAFSATLDLAAVRSGATTSDVPSSGVVQRTYWSRFDLGPGLGPERPIFRANRQPYTVAVPSCVEDGEVPVLTLALHSLGGNHGQYLAASPGFYEQLGEDRCSIVVTSLGRGPDGWYLDEAEADLFEVLADVLATYEVDLSHTLVHGYSMGGYGTYRLAGRYPDLFAATFPVVGPPYEGVVVVANTDDSGQLGFTPATGQVDPTTDTSPLLDSHRHLPMLAWHGTADELVPITSALTHLQRMHDNGYRFRQEVFAADHFLLATTDEWERATEVLGDRPEVVVEPAHVTYRAMPARDRGDLGLVADGAYWVQDVAPRDGEVVAGGLVDARTSATGEGDPVTAPIVDAGPAPLPYTARGLEWVAVGEVPERAAVGVDLRNIGAADLHLGAGRLPITADEDAVVAIDSDGPATLTLWLERTDVTWEASDGVEVVAMNVTAASDRADSGGGVGATESRPEPTLVASVPEGASTITIRPANSRGPGTGGPGTDGPGTDGPGTDGPGGPGVGVTPASTPLPTTGSNAGLLALLCLGAATALGRRRPTSG
jgi:S-formylglutathione hydrolase FrmB